MRFVRKIAILIMLVFMCTSFVGCYGNKGNHYIIKGQENITEEKLKALETRVDNIYGYFKDAGVKFKEEKLEIAEDDKDIDIIRNIIGHEFTEYVNYGLMYGVVYDCAKTLEISFEEIEEISLEEIEKNWNTLYLSYINFETEISSDSEKKIAKYVSVELVKYIKKNHGKEYLWELMRKSADPVKVNEVNEIMNKWIKEKNPDFNLERKSNRGVFRFNSQNDTVEYKAMNAEWVVYLNSQEKFDKGYDDDKYQSMHKNLENFYEYMEICFDEIERLEEEMGFDHTELPDVKIEIYAAQEYTGDFEGRICSYDNEKIVLKTLRAFSHKYIHFVDFVSDRVSDEAVINEMRAVYFSRDFDLEKIETEKLLKNSKKLSGETNKLTPHKKAEDFLGRKLRVEDFYEMINDLKVHELLDSNSEVPNLLEIRDYHPKQYWFSLMEYLRRTYGKEAFNTIMYDEKFNEVIEEWENYIKNFSEKDYWYIDESYTTEEKKNIEDKIIRIEEYLKQKGLVTKIDRSNIIQRIMSLYPSDTKIDDSELIKLILREEFSDYLNYGLMYGVMYDIAQNLDLNVEEIEKADRILIAVCWNNLFLTYSDFKTDLVTEKRKEVSKYVAVQVVNYIVKEYGQDFLWKLMKRSSDLKYANEVSKMMDEWIKSEMPDFNIDRIIVKEIFKINPEEDTVEYKAMNADWKLYLNERDGYDISMNRSIEDFYENMNIFYDEIERLERVLKFNHEELPRLNVIIYKEIESPKWAAGVYEHYKMRIQLEEKIAFGHEYVHYVDWNSGRVSKDAAVNEMTAEYFSKDYFSEEKLTERVLEDRRRRTYGMRDKGISLPYGKAKKFLGRELQVSDYYGLLNDLIIQEHINSGEGKEFPDLFLVESPYPTDYWISVVNYVIRTYGKENMYSVLFDEKLGDGTTKTMRTVVDEWKEYIKNLNEEDYWHFEE